MIKFFEWIIPVWQKYWGTGFYQYLLLMAVLYLVIWKRKQSSSRFFLGYMAVILVIFFCPFTGKLIYKCIGKKVYWRVLWLLPVIPVISYAFVECLRNRKSKWVRAVFVILFSAAIVLMGKNVITSGNFVTVHNFQKVPDEVAAICTMVRTDAGDGEILLASDDYVASYVRVFDPSINMPYGRRKAGARRGAARKLYTRMIAAEKNYKRIAQLAKKVGCNYIVLTIGNEEQKRILGEKGYEEVGMVNQYGIFRLNLSEM